MSNTPANAGNDAFAREAADRLLTEQWPVMSMFLTTQACIAAREKFVRDIIQQAIERDRVERDAASDPVLMADYRKWHEDFCKSSEAAVLKNLERAIAAEKQLAEQSAALEKLPKTKDGVSIFLGDTLWTRNIDTGYFGEEEWLELEVKSIYAGLSFPEYKGTVTICGEDIECGNLETYSTLEAAQIEALAGGTPLSKGTFSSGGKETPC